MGLGLALPLSGHILIAFRLSCCDSLLVMLVTPLIAAAFPDTFFEGDGSMFDVEVSYTRRKSVLSSEKAFHI